MLTQIKLIVCTFIFAGTFALLDLAFGLATTRSAIVSSVSSQVTNSRTYYTPCISELNFCERIQGSIKSFELNDKVWVHQYLNYSDLLLLILPSQVTFKNYELTKWSIWTGVPFVQIAFSILGLIFILIFIKLKSSVKK